MMTNEQIKKSDVMKLVKRLFEIDSKLCPETAMDVDEYNVIIEKIWDMINDKKDMNEDSERKVRIR